MEVNFLGSAHESGSASTFRMFEIDGVIRGVFRENLDWSREQTRREHLDLFNKKNEEATWSHEYIQDFDGVKFVYKTVAGPRRVLS